jgi:hypothetical protein
MLIQCHCTSQWISDVMSHFDPTMELNIPSKCCCPNSAHGPVGVKKFQRKEAIKKTKCSYTTRKETRVERTVPAAATRISPSVHEVPGDVVRPRRVT